MSKPKMVSKCGEQRLKLFFSDGTTLVIEEEKFNPEIFRLCNGLYVVSENE